MTNSVHDIVMRRVRTIHLIRTYAFGVSGAAFVVAGSLYLIGREVWVARVLQNMPQPTHVFELLRFITSAVVSTEGIVQLLIALTLAGTILLLREVGKMLSVQRLRIA
jgi:hypothetical protein